MSDMKRWQGKVAVVTGASSGIGAATVKRLLDAGMMVVGCARRKDRLSSLMQEADASGENSLALAVDLRNINQIKRMFQKVREQWGGVDVLVNCAGLGHDAPLISGDEEQWREMLDVNILALCVCTKEAITDMRQRGNDGHVIHVSSMAGHRVPPNGGVYAATKYAVRALTEGLRGEMRALGSHIRVSSVSPAYVETDFVAQYHSSQNKADEIFARFPVLQSDDIADAIVYMLSCPPHMQVHDILVRPTQQPN